MHDNDYLAEERDEQHTQLLHDVRELYDVHVENAASLTRIRARLLTGAESLPYSRSVEKERQASMKTIHALPFRERIRHPRLATLAAVLLVAVLVASTLALFNFRRPQEVSPKRTEPTLPDVGNVTVQDTSIPQIKLRSTWNEITTIEGTGNKTLTAVHISLPRLWGLTIACENGHASYEIRTSGKQSFVGGCGTKGDGPNATPEAEPVVGPSSSGLQLETDKIQKITISAAGNVTWHLQLARSAANVPILAVPQGDWELLKVTGGSGTAGFSGSFERNPGIYTSATLPKVWGIRYLCLGSGTLTVKLNPDVLKRTLLCNGQVHFEQVRDEPDRKLTSALDTGGNGSKMIGSDIDVQTGETNDWQLLLVGCTDTRNECQ